MENYIRELEQERIRELAAYLAVSGLDDYTLTSKEAKTLETRAGGAFQRFKIGDLFEIKSSAKKFNAIDVEFGNGSPYVVRTSLNNGIRGLITEDKKYLNPAGTISFGQDTATMFYQEKAYFTGDKIKIMSLKYNKLNSKLASYFITCMSKIFNSFKWGQSSFNENILKNVEISLPVTPDGQPDYEYMETYITAIQKLAIKNVVEWKNREIETTKQVVNV